MFANIEGSQKGGFQKCGFGRCSWTQKRNKGTKTGTRVQKRCSWTPRTRTRSRAYNKRNDSTKPRSEGTFAKTPSYKTALLSLLTPCSATAGGAPPRVDALQSALLHPMPSALPLMRNSEVVTEGEEIHLNRAPKLCNTDVMPFALTSTNVSLCIHLGQL